MLNYKLTTKQTKPEGVLVEKVISNWNHDQMFNFSNSFIKVNGSRSSGHI